MTNKLIVTLIISAVLAGSGCAHQEDMLHADLWVGDPGFYGSSYNESSYNEGFRARDMGKTPGEIMLEQRAEDERSQNKHVRHIGNEPEDKMLEHREIENKRHNKHIKRNRVDRLILEAKGLESESKGQSH